MNDPMINSHTNQEQIEVIMVLKKARVKEEKESQVKLSCA